MATSPGSMTLLDLQSRILHLLFEPGPDTGVTPVPTTGDFAAATLTRDINIGLGVFLGRTGMAPGLSDVMLTQAIVAGLDLAVPANLASLIKIEYTPKGQYPYALTGKSFDDFDETTGGIVPPATGQPYYYREPYAGFIRLQPQPGPANAIGDKITWYFQSLGSVLVASTDVPGIPAQFHMAPAYYCLKDYWRRKGDIAQAREYGNDFEVLVKLGKQYVFDHDRAIQPTLAGEDVDVDLADGYVG